METNELLTVDEAATLLRVNPVTIRRRIRAGEIRAVGGPRSTRIRREDLEIPSAISPQSVARLTAQARAAGMDPETLLQEWMTDFEETIGALSEGIEDARAGRVIRLEDHMAQDQERRRRRDHGHDRAVSDQDADAV